MDAVRLKVAQFRTMVKDILPYFTGYVYGMIATEKRGIGTMAVDERGRLYYDPALVERVDLKGGRFVICHEALHVALGHAPLARRFLGDRPTPAMLRRFNLAADCVVNGILQSWWHEAPSEEVLGGKLVTHVALGLPPSLTVTQYYALLEQQDEQRKQEREAARKQQRDNDPSQRGKGEDGDGMEDEGDEDQEDGSSDRDDDEEERGGQSDRGDHDSEGGEDGSDGDSEGGGDEPSDEEDGVPDGDAAGEGDAERKGDDDGDSGSDEGSGGSDSQAGDQGRGDEDDADGEADGGWACRGGGGADGQPREYEDEGEGGWADRQYSMTDQLEQRIEEAEQSSPGSVPGCLKDAVGLRLRPQADPFDVLRATVARAIASPVGAPDYTLRKFSRRQQADGPRLRGVKKEMPNVVVILDTSGSMHGDRVEKAMGVIAKAVSRLKSVKVVSFDSRLHDRKMVTSMGQFKWEGGGGTGMGRAIEEVDKADRPDAIVLITDLETDWPQRQPRARVVVAAVDAKDYWLERVPGWVKLCDVSKGGDR